MKIFVLTFLILSIPIQNAILKNELKNQGARKLWQNRNLACESSKSTFELIYVALIIFLFLSNVPRWALLLFSVPLILRLTRSIFADNHSKKFRKLVLNKKKISLIGKGVKDMEKKGKDMEKVKGKVLRFLKEENMLTPQRMRKRDMIAVVKKYYHDVKLMHGGKLSSQIEMVFNNIYKNKANILDLLKSMM